MTRVDRPTGESGQDACPSGIADLAFRSSLLDRIEAAIVATDEAHRITHWSSGAAAAFGFERDEVVGRTGLELGITPQSSAAGREALLAAARRGIASEREIRMSRRDGSTFEALVRAVPLSHPDGGFAGVLAITVEVDADRRAESEAARYAEQQWAIGRLIHAAVGREPVERIHRQAVAQARRIMGLDLAEIYELEPGGRSARLIAAAGEARPPGTSLALPGTHVALAMASTRPVAIPDVTSERRVRWLSWFRDAGLRSVLGVAIPRPDGVFGALCAYRARPHEFTVEETAFLRSVADILASAEARRYTDNLEAQMERARRMESVGQLAGGVAHDFNNLLLVIANCAEFIDGEVDPSSPVRGDVVEIQNATKRAAALTRRLAQFARQEVADPELVDVGHQLAETASLLKRTLGENVRLELGDPAGSLYARLEPGGLDQILVNLAVNARDAMPDGGRLIISAEHVELDLPHVCHTAELDPGPYVRVTVRDEGVGMPPEAIARAFEPFFTTKPPGEGTGFGLATVYGIVARAHGGIDLFSEPGRGTTLRVYLPEVGSLAWSSAPDDELEPGLRGSHETVLLVEDEHTARRVTERILVSAGYNVIHGADGPAAIDICDRHEPPVDLIVSDVLMPGMTGVELASVVGETHPTIPIVLVSGYSDDQVLSPDMRQRTEFLEKPFTRSELLTAVSSSLSRT